MIVDEMVEWCKCGEGLVSALPTLAWAVGAAWLAWRLLAALFRRSMFRRVPYWELALQHLLFCWLVLYSMHLWAALVRLVKLLVDYAYDEGMVAWHSWEGRGEVSPDTRARGRVKYVLQQGAVWLAAAAPLAAAARARRRPRPPPLMLWIPTSPWQFRELGPHGYYLQRPAPAAASAPAAAPAPAPRRAFSDPQLARRHTPSKRLSKSI